MKERTEIERRNRQASKTARVMVIASILDTRDNVHMEEINRIAKLLGASQRTVYRDIKVIRLARKILVDYARKLEEKQHES